MTQDLEEVGNWLNDLYEINDGYWVAAKDLYGSNEIMWVTDTVPVDVSLWGPDQPIHHQRECAYLDTTIYRLIMSTCFKDRYPLCKPSHGTEHQTHGTEPETLTQETSTHETAPANLTQSPCPPGSTRLDVGCFCNPADILGMTWSEAQDYCQNLPYVTSDLAVFDNTQVNLIK